MFFSTLIWRRKLYVYCLWIVIKIFIIQGRRQESNNILLSRTGSFMFARSSATLCVHIFLSTFIFGLLSSSIVWILLNPWEDSEIVTMPVSGQCPGSPAAAVGVWRHWDTWPQPVFISWLLPSLLPHSWQFLSCTSEEFTYTWEDTLSFFDTFGWVKLMEQSSNFKVNKYQFISAVLKLNAIYVSVRLWESVKSGHKSLALRLWIWHQGSGFLTASYQWRLVCLLLLVYSIYFNLTT